MSKINIYRLEQDFSFGSAPLTLEDVKEIKQRKFQTVISLVPIPGKIARALKEKGINWIPLYSSKLYGSERFDEITRNCIALKAGNTFVHCFAGEGLSPAVSIGYLASKGVPVDRAIRRVKKFAKILVIDPHVMELFESLYTTSKNRRRRTGPVLPKPRSAFAKLVKRLRRRG